MTEQVDGFNLMLDLLDDTNPTDILRKAQRLHMTLTYANCEWVQEQLLKRARLRDKCIVQLQKYY